MILPDPSTSPPAGDPSDTGDDLESSGPRRPLVVFCVADTWLALDASCVREIVDPGPAVPLPRLSPHLRGLLFLRGGGVPLVALDLFLDLVGESKASADLRERPARVVIVEADDMRVGIESSQVQGILEVSRQELHPPDAVDSQLKPYATAQIDGMQGPVAILDLARLLDDARPRGHVGGARR